MIRGVDCFNCRVLGMISEVYLRMYLDIYVRPSPHHTLLLQLLTVDTNLSRVQPQSRTRAPQLTVCAFLPPSLAKTIGLKSPIGVNWTVSRLTL